MRGIDPGLPFRVGYGPMKKLLALLTFVGLSLQSAMADWVIVQKMDADGQPQELKVQIKGDKTRMDMGQQMTIFADSTTGGMTMLMHAQKMMMKMDAEAMKKMAAMAGGALGAAGGPPAKPTATGQKEKVGEYETEIFTWKGEIGEGKFWVAKDFKGFEELNKIQDKLAKAMGNPVANVTPQQTDFPGMVIKSEITIAGKKVLAELVSAKEEPVADSAFEVPAGYQEMKLPGQ